MERRKQCEGKWVFIANNFPLAYLVRSFSPIPPIYTCFGESARVFPGGAVGATEWSGARVLYYPLLPVGCAKPRQWGPAGCGGSSSCHR